MIEPVDYADITEYRDGDVTGWIAENDPHPCRHCGQPVYGAWPTSSHPECVDEWWSRITNNRCGHCGAKYGVFRNRRIGGYACGKCTKNRRYPVGFSKHATESWVPAAGSDAHCVVWP